MRACICAYPFVCIYCIRKSIWIEGNQASSMPSHFILFVLAFLIQCCVLFAFFFVPKSKCKIMCIWRILSAAILYLVPSTRFPFSLFLCLRSLFVFTLPVFRISSLTNELRLLSICVLCVCMLSKPYFCCRSFYCCCLCRRSRRSIRYYIVVVVVVAALFLLLFLVIFN